ncbi:inositol-pentakisphosphate 2-kinase [Scleroderma yunnanense]
MNPVQITDTQPADWVYVSEGGASIVFSYRGRKDPRFDGRVLRLRKTNVLGSGVTPSCDIDGEEPDDPMISFQNDIISQLVPQSFLPELDAVLLDSSWLHALERLHNGDRPLERRMKDEIDKGRRKGVLATDLIGGEDTIAVEIKPKWGFLPKAHHLSEETVAIKTSTCRFCMHMFLRSEEGEFLSEYCPMDLYSQDEARVKKAVQNLWTGWAKSNGSLNNLRIFASGKMVKPAHDSYGHLVDLLAGGEPLTSRTDPKDAFISLLVSMLLSSRVLEVISTLQRMLDALDIEGLSKLHLEKAKSGLTSIITDPTYDDWRDFVASYRTGYCTWDHANPDPANTNCYLIAYLLSATFKDCSIILRIKQGNHSSHSVSIIDLDQKPINRLGKWEELDRVIVQRYRSASQQKRCIDQYLL